MKYLALIFSVLILSFPLSASAAAIAFDAASTGTASGAVTSLTFSKTNTGTATDGLLIACAISVDTNAATNDFSSFTDGGTTMTKVYDYVPSTNRRLGMYYLLKPPTGTNNVVVTMGSAVSNNIVGSASSFTGVSQTGFPDAQNKTDTTGTSVTTSVTTIADNAWLVGCEWNNSSTVPTAGTATTKRTSSTYGNAFVDTYDSNGAKTPAGSYSLIVNDTSSDSMSLLVLSIAPNVPAAAATSILGLVRSFWIY